MDTAAVALIARQDIGEHAVEGGSQAALSQLEEVQKQQVTNPSGGAPTDPAAVAERVLLAARRQAIEHELKVYREELRHYETMMGVLRGRLAVTMDMITDAMALVGQHGVYCQSQRWPGKPVMDIQIIMESLTDAKELIQSVMEELKSKG